MNTEFDTVLIANRGEIACRVIRTCRAMGLRTVAVASEADVDAVHARLADQVVVLGPASALESYLRVDRILDAARESGAGAIHPGYGFLAENAGFSRACTEAGLVFIGPRAETIETMGEKTAARAIMEKAGVPVVPGALLPEPDADGEFSAADVLAAVATVGTPLLIKAAFGGGGKGMRLVRDSSEAPAAVAAAAREALKAFGNGRVYLERYLERPRHVEFQVFGDTHGGAVHLGERECSIQRRHQKIIEETPSPAVDEDLRVRMGEAAVAATTAAQYVGAGTVEFLLADDGSFYFLEMNTRLQVEHPVTELVTGQDLVRVQIDVARGRPLPWMQEELVARGCAIECRLYAEDPAHGFLPSTGRLLVYREPGGPGVRIDSGVAEGDEITPFYDPMLAKLSTHGASRAEAIDRMRDALSRYPVLGVHTNIAFLDAVLAHEAFRSGCTHTGFLEEYFEHWSPDTRNRDVALAACAAQESSRSASRTRGTAGSDLDLSSPWERCLGFRLRGMA